MFTMSLSVFFALVFLPSMLYFLGPQNKQGDMKHYIWQPIKRKLCGKKAEED
jgi:hypothetical protein